MEHHDGAVGHAARDARNDGLRRSPPEAVEASGGPTDDGHRRATYAPGGGDARVAEGRTEENIAR